MPRLITNSCKYVSNNWRLKRKQIISMDLFVNRIQCNHCAWIIIQQSHFYIFYSYVLETINNVFIWKNYTNWSNLHNPPEVSSEVHSYLEHQTHLWATCSSASTTSPLKKISLLSSLNLHSFNLKAFSPGPIIPWPCKCPSLPFL